MPIKEIGRKHRFSGTSFYKRLSKYGVMKASKAKRLWELELENGKLKRLLAEGHLWTSTPLKSSLAESASATHAPLWG